MMQRNCQPSNEMMPSLGTTPRMLALASAAMVAKRADDGPQFAGFQTACLEGEAFAQGAEAPCACG
jgi:hypothetical protein